MNLLRSWRWIRAAIIELTGLAACLLLIGFSQAERTSQPDGHVGVNWDKPQQSHDNGKYTEPFEGEMRQFLGVVLERILH